MREQLYYKVGDQVCPLLVETRDSSGDPLVLCQVGIASCRKGTLQYMMMTYAEVVKEMQAGGRLDFLGSDQRQGLLRSYREFGPDAEAAFSRGSDDDRVKRPAECLNKFPDGLVTITIPNITVPADGPQRAE